MGALIFAFALFIAGLQAAQAQPSDPHPLVAAPALIQAFPTHPVVAIAEAHCIRRSGDFYVSLIKDPEFAKEANDIVIEFGSRRSQPTLDRYVNGENVSQEELQHVWRDTTKVLSWESPIYAELLAAVREVNGKLPKNRRLRVLGGDSPIDWDKIHTNAEWNAFQPNNNSFAWVISNEVLKKRRKALVILGGNHLTKGGDRLGDPDSTSLVEKEYPNSMFVALMYTSSVQLPHEAEERIATWKAPFLLPATGWVAATPVAGRTLGELADAILYLGPKDSLTQAQPNWDLLAQDAAYIKELTRRYKIVYDCDFDFEQRKTGGRPCRDQ